MNRLIQLVRTCLVTLLLGGLSGCSDYLPVMVPFGAVTSADQYRTLNGLGIHRRMWESTGAKVLTPQKLSPRLETIDVIVLVGQAFDPPGQEAREWLENWLAAEPQRTVIYFGRDFNASLYYRQQTLAQLSPELQPRGEQLLALEQAIEMQDRLQQLPESTFCDWFYLDVAQPPHAYTSFQGDWASAVSGLRGSWPTGVLLQPPSAKFKNKKPSWLTTAGVNPLKPASTFQTAEEMESHRSEWQPAELKTNELWDAAFEDLPQSETLLAAADGQVLLYRLTHQRFAGSQIIIATNGAPLLNGTLVEPLQQRIGEKLIEECLPATRIALLAYSENGLLISTAPEADLRGAGLEMLTVWPLSGITMPAALLGLVVCAMLIPILGRPQSLPRRSVSDFGLHIEALGRMLHESRDLEYAKSAISEYFRRVRGEAPPTWLEELGQTTPTPAPVKPAPVKPAPVTSATVTPSAGATDAPPPQPATEDAEKRATSN